MIDKVDLFDNFVDCFDRKEREKVEDDRWADLWQELYSTMAESHVDLIKEQERAMVETLRNGGKPEIPRLLDFCHHMVFMADCGQLNHKLCLPEPIGQVLIEFPQWPYGSQLCRSCDYNLPIGQEKWLVCPVCGGVLTGAKDIKSPVPVISK